MTDCLGICVDQGLVLASDSRTNADYLRELRAAWQSSLKRAFESLPELSGLTPSIRLVDSADD